MPEGFGATLARLSNNKVGRASETGESYRPAGALRCSVPAAGSAAFRELDEVADDMARPCSIASGLLGALLGFEGGSCFACRLFAGRLFSGFLSLTGRLFGGFLGLALALGRFALGDAGVAGFDNGAARRTALLSLRIFLRHFRPELLQESLLRLGRGGPAIDEIAVFESAQRLPSCILVAAAPWPTADDSRRRGADGRGDVYAKPRPKAILPMA